MLYWFDSFGLNHWGTLSFNDLPARSMIMTLRERMSNLPWKEFWGLTSSLSAGQSVGWGYLKPAIPCRYHLLRSQRYPCRLGACVQSSALKVSRVLVLRWKKEKLYKMPTILPKIVINNAGPDWSPLFVTRYKKYISYQEQDFRTRC